MLSIVAAIAENNIIGKDNALVWSIPGDLERFKTITLSGSQCIIMGRRTFESIGRVLPGRNHVVVTRNTNYNINNSCVEVVHSMDELTPYIESSKEYFVIGGGEIFTLLLPYVTKMYITKIHDSFKGDTFFPDFNKKEWGVVHHEEIPADEINKHDTTFMILEKI